MSASPIPGYFTIKRLSELLGEPQRPLRRRLKRKASHPKDIEGDGGKGSEMLISRLFIAREFPGYMATLEEIYGHIT